MPRVTPAHSADGPVCKPKWKTPPLWWRFGFFRLWLCCSGLGGLIWQVSCARGSGWFPVWGATVLVLLSVVAFCFGMAGLRFRHSRLAPVSYRNSLQRTSQADEVDGFRFRCVRIRTRQRSASVRGYSPATHLAAGTWHMCNASRSRSAHHNGSAHKISRAQTGQILSSVVVLPIGCDRNIRRKAR